MWDPTVGLGTVTHEYIGYLLPMGPFFAVFHLLGVPVWVAQRLWLGSILMGAGVGVLYLSRILGLRGPGPTAAALAYMLSPYFLQYAGRISVILLPWAGLPVHAGADHRGAAPGRVARAGAVRRGGGARERHQRQLHHLRRRGADPLDPLRRGRPAGVDLAPRPRHHAAHRRPDAGRLPVVDRRSGGGGRLRRQRPEVHRDGPLDVGHLQRGGHHPGPRLLVLLRHRPPRARGRRRPSATPRTSGCWRPRTPCPSSPWWRRRSCAGASAPSSWCCSSWG